jgi:inner membrane protein
MMSLTHCAIALCTTSITLGTGNAFTLTIAALGSQLPDLDSSTSWIGRALYPASSFLEKRFAHRTITHSFLSTAAIAVVGLPLCYWDWQWWAGLVLGQFSGWFADAFTRSGVAAFYPSTVRLVIPGNPKARIRSRSPAEYWVLAIAVFLAAVSINLASAGGVTEQFARLFFPDISTTVRLFDRYGSEQVITIDLEGRHNHTGERVSGTYTVLEAGTTDVLVESEDGRLYKVGRSPDAQIRPSRVQTNVAGRLRLESQEMVVSDQAVMDFCQQVPADAYVSGVLLLEEMDQVQLASSFVEYDTVRTWGGQVELRQARCPVIGAQLGEFWIVQGKLILKQRKS